MATIYSRIGQKNIAETARGQRRLIFETLAGLPGAKGTLEQITNAAKGAMVTRQDPARVTAYYLAIFKKQGLVASASEPVGDPNAPATPAETEDADVEDEDADVEDENGDDDEADA